MLTSTLLPNPLNFEYGQSPQPNPLEFAVYWLTPEEKFEPQTNWFRCRDFFNDLVAKYFGHPGRVYGFDTEKINLNDYGVWIRLRNLTPAFYKNVELFLPLLKEIDVELKFVPLDDDPTQCLVIFPRRLFDSTWLISKVTLFIRMCNEDKEYTSWDTLVAESPEPLVLQYRHCVTARGFMLPQEYQKYWYYSHSKVNSENEKHYIGTIHNCGFVMWEQLMGATK